MANWAGRTIATALLIALAAGLTGCEVFGYVAGGFSKNKKPAVYELKDVPTVILVDDPGGLLGDPNLPGTVAMFIAVDLKENKALSNIVDIKEVAALSQELGSKYATTPVDQIGRKLNATQVIHVHIDSVPPFQTEPGTLRPLAGVLVKVIDAEHRVRLFPGEGQPTDRGAYPLTVTMRMRVADDRLEAGLAAYRQRFAERIGTDIAKLFYEHSTDKDMRSE